MLQVRNLTIRYRDGDDRHGSAVDNVSFDLVSGEAVGVLGESGCGKTTLALALLQLLPAAARVISGSIRLGEHDILRADERTLRVVRGAEASMIFQEPALSLNPVMRAGDQVAEVVRAHKPGKRSSYKRAAELALRDVSLSDPRIYSSYPHQLSSGQRQRIAIAQALVCRPKFLIADEPTSALDTVTQAEVLRLLIELRQRYRLTLLMITHNAALLSGLADRVMIMRAGSIVEEGPLAQVYANPKHEYTKGMLRSFPRSTAAGTANPERARAARQ